MRYTWIALVGLISIIPASAWAEDDFAWAVSDSTWVAATIPVALTLFGDDDEEHTGRTMLDAAVVSVALSEGLKRVTNEPRPFKHRQRDGFPSAHSAFAWALAESASEEYRDARPYAYAWAAGVTWSRVATNRHTELQAVAGAALGWTVGHISANKRGGILNGLIVNDEPPKPGSRLTFRPSYDPLADDSVEWRVRVWEASW